MIKFIKILDSNRTMVDIREKRFLAVLLLSFVFISLFHYASALDVKITDVKITTSPLRDVVVTFYKVGTEDVIQQFNEKSYVEGKVNFKFYSLESNFDYEVKVLFGDNEIASKKFENAAAKTPIVLTIGLDEADSTSENSSAVVDNSGDIGDASDGASEDSMTEESSSASEQSTSTTKQSGDNQNAVSGAAIIGDNTNVTDYWYFIAAGVLGLGLLGFLVTRRIYASHGVDKGNFVPPKTIQRSVDPSKPVVSPKSENELEKRIADAEARIQEAQNDLRKIKEQERVKLAEKKIQRDTEELNKLKKQQDKVDSE